MAQSKNEFYLRRIHSLLGIIPIGAFLIVHLLVNHQATQGAEAFNKASGFMESLPFLLVVEFVLIYIPLLYHGLFGLHIAFTAKRECWTLLFIQKLDVLLPKSKWYFIFHLYRSALMANTSTKGILR